MKNKRNRNKNFEDSIFIHDKYVKNPLRFIIWIAMNILSFWYNLLLLIARFRKKSNDNKYYFSICAIFKDEELSLKEWIEYHKIVGVDHIYLYNNFSTDNYLEILDPYIKSGYITLIEWPVVRPAQAKAYNHFYNNFWNETKWVAFIDLDEYLCPKRVEDIKIWFSFYENFPSMVIYWKQFGSSGRIDHDHSKLITEQYFISWNKFYDMGKPVFNTDFELYKLSDKYIHLIFSKVNFMGFEFKLPPINEFKKFINFRCNRVGLFKGNSDFTFQLNHYVTKSYGEFTDKKVRRGTATSVGETAAHIRSQYAYDFAQSYAITADYTIYRFLIKLKIAMLINKKGIQND
ncbi:MULTISPECIES: glycosyltransferase family 92 protein [Sphingobacterium]|uniref:glycosyltransferase family 92 protein n=1 Tax=Sphingobacterium TaxID=28453 RepID=UPI0025803CA1|nr:MULTISPECIES: glycosyltransferase family 92 protein [Sphingobacterium]